jgi:NAD(P)-dependent dehydrogenase (short-subunit alcohol dehydrogenase family)
MDLGLRGKVALITGGSKGIGRAIATGLAREGAKVAICARNAELLERAAGEIAQATGSEALPVPGDMSKPGDADRVAAGVVSRYGRIDILVNNAGAAPGGLLLNLTEEDWALAMQLKFLGYVRCCKAVIPHMLKQGGGRIVNIVGNDGVKPAYWELTASAANAAGLAAIQALAEQYGKHNIQINAINPGPVSTERWDGLVRAYARDKNLPLDEAARRAVASIPLGRICTPEEVADLAVFVASDRARFMTGASIALDGGQRKALMDL